jgi:hypothetical protein
VRTVDYSDVLRGSAALAGLGASDVGIGEFALFREFHDRRFQKAWEIHRWPDLCRTEQRTFRPLWSSANTYVVTAEVYDVPTATYYQSLQNANTNNPPSIAGAENSAWWAKSLNQYSAPLWASGVTYAVGTQVQNPNDLNYYQCITAHTSGGSFDPSKFGLLTPFDRYVAFDQVDAAGNPLTPIGEFFFCTDINPKLSTKTVEFPFDLSENGAQFVQLKHEISFVWVHFRIRRQLLAGDDWDAGLAYASGTQVYYVGTGNTIQKAKGNFFTATASTSVGDSPETAPNSWSAIQIPYIFRAYLITGGYADWLTGDGQANKAAGYEGMAVESLEAEADKLQRQSQQVRRLTWKR